MLPEAMRRWRVCYAASASRLEAEAQSRHAEALTASRPIALPDEARMTRKVAKAYEATAWKYRRALLIPWEFWSLGGDFPFDLLDQTGPPSLWVALDLEETARQRLGPRDAICLCGKFRENR